MTRAQMASQPMTPRAAAAAFQALALADDLARDLLRAATDAVDGGGNDLRGIVLIGHTGSLLCGFGPGGDLTPPPGHSYVDG
jgi:hypothetical protein